MPSPIELTTILLAGLISTGDYDRQCPPLAEELIRGALEAKYRAVEVKEPWDDFERAYFNYQIKRRL